MAALLDWSKILGQENGFGVPSTNKILHAASFSIVFPTANYRRLAELGNARTDAANDGQSLGTFYTP